MPFRAAVVAVVLSSGAAAPRTAHAQEGFFLGFSTTYAVFPTRLPADYLSAIIGRDDVQAGADMSDNFGISARVGIAISRTLSLRGVADISPTNVLVSVAATRIYVGVTVNSIGVELLYSFDALYFMAGAGAVTLDSERIGSDTSFGWTSGVGYRHKSFRFELRDRMTINALSPSTENTFLHTIQFSTGIVLSP